MFAKCCHPSLQLKTHNQNDLSVNSQLNYTDLGRGFNLFSLCKLLKNHIGLACKKMGSMLFCYIFSSSKQGSVSVPKSGFFTLVQD